MGLASLLGRLVARAPLPRAAGLRLAAPALAAAQGTQLSASGQGKGLNPLTSIYCSYVHPAAAGVDKTGSVLHAAGLQQLLGPCRSQALQSGEVGSTAPFRFRVCSLMHVHGAMQG